VKVNKCVVSKFSTNSTPHFTIVQSSFQHSLLLKKKSFEAAITFCEGKMQAMRENIK